MTAEFDFMSAVELRRLIGRREISPVELTARSLERAAETQSTINAFFVITPEKAMKAAREAEDTVLQGKPLGPLHGLPISVKDLISVKDERYASGSLAMAKNIATVDAPSVERLKAAGAVVIGKTTTSEFGCKAIGDSPLTGTTKNPWDLSRTAGGSSSGAAASVAAGVTPLALGTDGGGSIRIPASLCGLAGIKGQFGRIPVWPTSSTPSLAHVGPIARSIGDAAMLYAAILGHDNRDSGSAPALRPNVLGALGKSVTGLRVAYSATLGYAEPDSEIVEVTRAAASALSDLDCVVEDVDQVFERDPADLWTAEFFAGVGTRLAGLSEEARAQLDPAVGDILSRALKSDLRTYYQSVFERYALRDRLQEFFGRYDILLSPVTPVASLPTAVNTPTRLIARNPVTWAYYTYPFNLTGNPAATVCIGQSHDKMPIGIQIVGRSYGEEEVVRVADAIERSTARFRRPWSEISV